MNRDLESLYEEARSALKAKDYDRASGLFRQILLIDENYKDASRLLAQSVKLRRRRWYNNPRVWGTFLAIGVLSSLIWLMPKISFPVTPSLTITVTATSAMEFTPTKTEIPTTTTTPTPVSTSLPLTWKRLNPGQFSPPAPINHFVVDPLDPEVIYVGTVFSGTFRTIDGGISWQPIQYNGIPGPIYPNFIDPTDSQIMYIESGWGGSYYRTTDGGRNWQVWETGGGGGPRFDPRTSSHIYSYHDVDRRLYESVDGGESWQLIYEPVDGRCSQENSILVIKYPPQNSTPMMLATNMSATCGLYQSLDNGYTWTFLGLPDRDFGDLTIGENDRGQDIFYAYTDQDGLIISYDYGKTWVDQSTANCLWVGIAIDKSVPTRAYCINQAGLGLKVTEDSGYTWKDLSPDLGVGQIGSIIIQNYGEEQYLFISSDSGLFMSADSGLTWSRRSNGLGVAIMQLAIDPADPSILYVDSQQTFSTQSCNLYRSDDKGQNWKLILLGEPPSSCEPKFDSKNTLYVASHATIQRSRDRGENWETFSAQDTRVNWIGVSPYSEHRIVIGDNFNPSNQFTYSDSGKTWQRGTGIFSSTWLGFEIRTFFDNANKRIYAISFRDAFYSEDEGFTWQTCSFPSGAVNFDGIFVIDPSNPQRLFLATIGGKYWSKGGLYISNDACQSWQPTSLGEIDSFVNTVAIDPNNSDIVYAGASTGAYISYDGGMSWEQVKDGLLGATMVYSIVVDKDSNVYAATPYGIFKLENK